MDWGGTVPATDVLLADYLARHAGTLSVATRVRRIASISKAHSAKGRVRTASRSELVKSDRCGGLSVIADGHRGNAGAKPLTKEDLFDAPPRHMRRRSLEGRCRDKALLLVGFERAISFVARNSFRNFLPMTIRTRPSGDDCPCPSSCKDRRRQRVGGRFGALLIAQTDRHRFPLSSSIAACRKNK